MRKEKLYPYDFNYKLEYKIYSSFSFGDKYYNNIYKYSSWEEHIRSKYTKNECKTQEQQKLEQKNLLNFSRYLKNSEDNIRIEKESTSSIGAPCYTVIIAILITINQYDLLRELDKPIIYLIVFFAMAILFFSLDHIYCNILKKELFYRDCREIIERIINENNNDNNNDNNN